MVVTDLRSADWSCGAFCWCFCYPASETTKLCVFSQSYDCLICVCVCVFLDPSDVRYLPNWNTEHQAEFHQDNNHLRSSRSSAEVPLLVHGCCSRWKKATKTILWSHPSIHQTERSGLWFFFFFFASVIRTNSLYGSSFCMHINTHTHKHTDIHSLAQIAVTLYSLWLNSTHRSICRIGKEGWGECKHKTVGAGMESLTVSQSNLSFCQTSLSAAAELFTQQN